MLHGKMKPKEKEGVMAGFLNREVDVMVSTSVVEVGVDIPNATIMMIEGAEHFGLAQLHQFRGRVGRGNHQSYCLLLTDSPARQTNRRMKALLAANSGFELAEHDLRIRGPGDFYGVRQAGLADLTMSILSDLGFVREARNEAQRLLKADPSLAGHPQLAEVLDRFWQSVHFE
jgi:ATP-dependent DNA helicase RecG